jgi:predicted AAA+ superfamily ATPase
LNKKWKKVIKSLIREKQHEIPGIDNILYINFEDERISSIKVDELHLLLECYQEMYDSKPWIFLDEIQIVEGWEKFVRRLADSQYKVFVTGSTIGSLSLGNP